LEKCWQRFGRARARLIPTLQQVMALLKNNQRVLHELEMLKSSVLAKLLSSRLERKALLMRRKASRKSWNKMKREENIKLAAVQHE